MDFAATSNLRMNPNPIGNPAPSERFSNATGNFPNQQMGGNLVLRAGGIPMNTPQNIQQQRPMRMEQPNQNYNQGYQQQLQQQHQQQRNVYQNQQGSRLSPNNDPVRFQSVGENGPRPNDSFQNSSHNEFQSSSENVPQPSQRTFPGQQQRFPGPQPVRPTLNEQLNQSKLYANLNNQQDPRLPINQQMDTSKQPTQQIQPNSQMGEPNTQPHRNPNDQTEIHKIPPKILSRKSSNVDFNSVQGAVNQQKTINDVEQKPSMGEINENKPTPIRRPSEKDINNQNQQKSQPIPTTIENEPSTKSVVRESETKKTGQEDVKPKKETREEVERIDELTKKSNDDPSCGIVLNKIKFFEENDTAKTPLIPKLIPMKRNNGSVVPSSKSGNSESGVDDSPMIHPNLRSIYREPCKVVSLARLRPNQHATVFKKIKSVRNRSRYLREKFSEAKPPWTKYAANSKSLQNLPVTSKKEYFKKQNNNSYSPEEELLAFFQRSRSVPKLTRDASPKGGQTPTKDKLAAKPTTNGDIASPKKTPSKLPAPTKKNPSLSSPTKTPLKSPGTPGPKSLPKTPESPSPPTPLIKKVPMNKIQVGAAPSPNLKAVRSKVGSLVNTTHKPGGGNIKIESHKVDFSKTESRVAAKNDQYAPSGGDKKIPQVKLQWSAKSKVGSLENATYKPGGGDKKIESVKLDFKEKAKPKVGSKDNVKHVPGGGTVKIENQKLEFKAQSKVGSLDNVKHKPGGGDIKIFDDKTYLKQVSAGSSEGRVSGTQSFGDLSVVREVEGRSAPGTPGRKTSVKIRKTTTILSAGATPSLKNVTEVTVTSQTPKKEKTVEKSPSKQQVKLTYSKLSSSESSDNIGSVEVVKVPARDHAPILKPSLSNKDEVPDISEYSKKSVGFDNTETKKDIKNLENIRQSSGSSDLPDGKFNSKNDSGMSKFLQDEIAAHKKVGELWKEVNNFENKPKEPQQQPEQNSLPSFNRTGNDTQQNKPSELQNSNDSTLTQFSNYSSIQHQQRPRQPLNQPNPQSQQQFQNLQMRFPPSSQQQESRFIAPPHQQQSFFINPEFQQNQSFNRPPMPMQRNFPTSNFQRSPSDAD